MLEFVIELVGEFAFEFLGEFFVQGCLHWVFNRPKGTPNALTIAPLRTE